MSSFDKLNLNIKYSTLSDPSIIKSDNKIIKSNSLEPINLRGKRVSTKSFIMWKKWNFTRGITAFDGLAYFSGEYFSKNDTTYIIGTIYPKPFLTLSLYIEILSLIALVINPLSWIEESERLIVIIGLSVSISIILLIIVLTKKRIKNSIIHHLKIKVAPQQKL